MMLVYFNIYLRFFLLFNEMAKCGRWCALTTSTACTSGSVSSLIAEKHFNTVTWYYRRKPDISEIRFPDTCWHTIFLLYYAYEVSNSGILEHITAAPVNQVMCTFTLLQLRIFEHQFIVDWFILFENRCIIIVAKLRKKVTMC